MACAPARGSPHAAVCALLFVKDGFLGWAHQRSRQVDGPQARLGLCGAVSLALCCGYCLTDMSGLPEVALPTNPGGVFKAPDVAMRSQVWSRWGYGDVQMRV